MINIREKILDKARKLKALSCSSNEHEAALALSRMQLILAKNGLVERDLYKDEFGRLFFEYNGQPWARYIIQSISELYFCKLVYMPLRSGKARYTIIGSDVNTQVVREFSIPILDNTHYYARQAANSSAEITSFRLGAAIRLTQRCQDLIKIATEGRLVDDSECALVLGDYYKTNGDKILNWMGENMSGLKTSKSRSTKIDVRSFEKGKMYGNTVELQRKIVG
jgi:hypothetical protein